MPKAVVTGANRGIGLALCRELSAMGWDVIAICRKKSKELEALPVKIEQGVDIRNVDQLQRVKKKIKGKVDLLINNAGILRDDTLEHPHYDWFLEQFEVNVLGSFKVTRTFLPLLKRGSKIVLISSWAGSIERRRRAKEAGGIYGYRVSKCAVNMLGTLLSFDLKKKGITVLLMHPGVVNTRLVEFQGEIEPEESARKMLQVIKKSTIKQTGSYLTYQGDKVSW